MFCLWLDLGQYLVHSGYSDACCMTESFRGVMGSRLPRFRSHSSSPSYSLISTVQIVRSKGHLEVTLFCLPL